MAMPLRRNAAPMARALLPPRFRQIALRRTIRHVEMRRVAAAGRQRMTEQANRCPGTQRLPQGFFGPRRCAEPQVDSDS